MAPEPVISRKRRLAALLLTLGVVTGMGALAFELLAFFVLDIKLPGYGQERFFQYSHLTGFSHTPNADGTWYRYDDGSRFHVRTNSFGFPDSDRSLEKKRPRIALIGDSATQAWEAAESDRPHVVLEELLDGRYEVLNMGVRAFGTDQTYLMFREVGVHFAPDIVVYTFSLNDPHDNQQNERKPYFVFDESDPSVLRLRGYPVAMPEPRPAGWLALAKHSFFLRRTYRLASQWFGEPTPLSDHFELRPYKTSYDEVDSERMNLTLALIGELNQLTRSRGIRLLIVEAIYRHTYDERARAGIRAAYGDRFDFDKVSRTLAAYAEDHGIPFLSLPRRWRAQGVSIEKIMHPEDNLHVNGFGNRLYARSLYEELDALGWLR